MENMIYIYIFATPPIERDAERFGINYMSAVFPRTEIWDLSPIINPVAFNSVSSGIIEGRVVIYTKKEFQKRVKLLPVNTLFIFTVDYNLSSAFVHRVVSKKHSYGYVGRNNTDFEINIKSTKERIKRLFSEFSIQRLLNAIYVRVPHFLLPIKPAKFVILGGKKNRDIYLRIAFIDKNNKVKHIHSADYECCLDALKTNKRIINKKYCVFLDTWTPYHPDGVSAGMVIDDKEYFLELDSFFKYIEMKYNLKVVIAAHPRSDYQSKPWILPNIEKIRFKTAELVKDAEFVISHFSSSSSMAAIFNKPMILITTDAINKYDYWVEAQNQIADQFGCKIYNISSDSYKKTLPAIIEKDSYKYHNYVCDYMSGEGHLLDARTLPWAIQFVDFLKEEIIL